MVNSRKFIYKTPFVGEPKESDFELVEEELPELKENGKYQKTISYPVVNL